MKKVLVVTYYWPPSGGPGVQRWLKFAKYMPRFEAEPLILTVDPQKATYPLKDESLAQEVSENLKVFYTNTSEPYNTYKKLFGRKQVPYSGFANESRDGFVSKFSRFIRGNLFIPDARVGWNKYALLKALELIDQYQIETVITTSPPHSTQLIGLKIKKERPDVKWIADLRDPWTDIFYYDKMLHLPWVKKKDARLEREVLLNADVVVSVGNFLLNSFKLKHTGDKRPEFIEISNGFDPDDFIKSYPQPDNKDFIITYTGTVSDEYDLDGFIRSLNNVKSSFGSRLRLVFVGQICNMWREKLQQFFKNELQMVEHVSHDKAIEYMHAAHLLLLAIPRIKGNEGIVTGKIFEYLAVKRPILGIGPPDGDASDILNQTGSGKMFYYDDREGIETFLKQFNDNRDFLSFADPECYSRLQLTQKLATLFK